VSLTGRARAHQQMGQGEEFDTIRMLMKRWGDLAVDIGDDAAVLPSVAAGVRVVSTDACVEDVHFRRAWISPHEVGARAAAAALSDLAAMGADAECMLVAFVVPDDWRSQLPDVADGIGALVRAAGARIVGGNLSSGRTFGISLTVMGRADHVVSRAGAQVGDLVLVTGTLGGPGDAIAAWDAAREPGPWSRERFARPVPRLREGRLLASAGATAMLDISDGLAADARHLEAASRVQLVIDAERVPRGAGITAGAALTSGEEYELLVTLPPGRWEALQQRWPGESEVPLTVIGEVRAAPATGDDGLPNASHVTGHDHFAPPGQSRPR
jgi:thiamine-monophosphate kinase